MIRIDFQLKNTIFTVILTFIIHNLLLSVLYSQAEEIPDRAKIEKVKGVGVLLTKEGKIPIKAQGGELRKYKDSLTIPGQNDSRAHLRFSVRGKFSAFLVQVGPYQKTSEYMFPCKVKSGKSTLGWGLRRDNPGSCRSIKVINNKHQVTQFPSHYRSLSLQASNKIVQAQVLTDSEQYYCGAVPSSSMGQGAFAVGSSLEEACQKSTEKCQINLGGLVANQSPIPNPSTSPAGQGGGELPQTSQPPLWGSSESKVENKVDSSAVSSSGLGNSCSVASVGDWMPQEPVINVSMLCLNSRSQEPGDRYTIDQIKSTGSRVETDLLSLEQRYSGDDIANCEPMVYTPDEVILVPLEDHTLIQTQDDNGSIVINVLAGSTTFISNDFPKGQSVKEGFRYRQGDSKFELINNCQQIRESEDIQVFLDSENWLDEGDLSTESISKQLEIYKAEFCQSSEPKKPKKEKSIFIEFGDIFNNGTYRNPPPNTPSDSQSSPY